MQHAALFDAIVKPNFTGMPLADHLQQLSKAHPYFSPAHFYLLQQLRPGDEAYALQAAKTAILFNNPYWLQLQLQQSKSPAVAVKETPVINMYEGNAGNDDDNALLVKNDEIIAAAPEEIIQHADQDNSIVFTAPQEMEPAAMPENSDNDDDAAILVSHAEPAAEIITATPEEIIHHADQDNTVVFTAPEEMEPASIPENSDNDDDAAVLVSTAAPAAAEQDEADDTEAPEEIKTEQEMPSIKIDLAAAIKEAENDNALSFEPMHLVDYFASQGIKLTDDLQTADKLGKQLKSFTEWLKIMKKVHVPDPETGAITADASIQNMAEKSNAGGEIVTEAMAEVFAQQGKTGKAIEVYKKLSLLNPLKSAFFAAKIEQLKGS